MATVSHNNKFGVLLEINEKKKIIPLASGTGKVKKSHKGEKNVSEEKVDDSHVDRVLTQVHEHKKEKIVNSLSELKEKFKQEKESAVSAATNTTTVVPQAENTSPVIESEEVVAETNTAAAAEGKDETSAGNATEAPAATDAATAPVEAPVKQPVKVRTMKEFEEERKKNSVVITKETRKFVELSTEKLTFLKKEDLTIKVDSKPAAKNNSSKKDKTQTATASKPAPLPKEKDQKISLGDFQLSMGKGNRGGYRRGGYRNDRYHNENNKKEEEEKTPDMQDNQIFPELS